MKIFPSLDNPPTVLDWHVPVSTTNLSSIVDDSWDLTMKAIVPLINGVDDVHLIARKADVDLDLAKKAFAHLLYRQVVTMIDIFFYQNIYGCTPDISNFVINVDKVHEDCMNYCCVRHETPAPFYLVKAMSGFDHSKTVMQWIKSCRDSGFDIHYYLDVRRFISFGVVSGYLHRVHTYPVSPAYIKALASGSTDLIATNMGIADGTKHKDQLVVQKRDEDKEKGAENGKGKEKQPVKTKEEAEVEETEEEKATRKAEWEAFDANYKQYELDMIELNR